MPEKMRIATRAHVEMMPIAEEKERYRSGKKPVGMILITIRASASTS
jgi:hypothetical protein